MKLEIFGDVADTETVVRVALVETSVGDVILHAVNAKGEHIESGNLVTLKRDGTIDLNVGINHHLGFSLDADGRLNTGRY